MRIILFGATGMLGQCVKEEALANDHVVVAPDRKCVDLCYPQDIYDFIKRYPGVDVIINCAGAVPNIGYSRLEMIQINSIAPLAIAEAAPDTQIIHVSTDCVFSGQQGASPAKITRRPDPIDEYGRTKLLGEINAPNVCNVRTSFIGYGRHGLLKWLTENKNGSVDGWGNAYWSGSTTNEVARSLIEMTKHKLNNIEHLATAVEVTKAGVLYLLNNALRLNITIKVVDKPVINRSLSPTIVMRSMAECISDLL